MNLHIKKLYPPAYNTLENINNIKFCDNVLIQISTAIHRNKNIFIINYKVFNLYFKIEKIKNSYVVLKLSTIKKYLGLYKGNNKTFITINKKYIKAYAIYKKL